MVTSPDGLGRLYKIPTKSSSAVIPDMVLTMDVPIETMARDAYESLRPTIEQRLRQVTPYIVDDAWPRAEDRLLQSLPKLMPPVVTEFRKNQDLLLSDRQRNLITLGTIVAIGALGFSSYWLWKRLK